MVIDETFELKQEKWNTLCLTLFKLSIFGSAHW